MALAPFIEPSGEPDDQEAVAANIRALMGRYRVSQQRLASAIGVDASTLSRKLAGKREFTVRELGKIARVFGKSLGDIVTPLFLASMGVLYVTRTEHPPEDTAIAVQLSLFEGISEEPERLGDVDLRPVTIKEAA